MLTDGAIDAATLMDSDQLRAEIEKLHTESYGWAMSCCRRRPAQAEDVLQTAYLKTLSGKARYDGRSAFKTWLFAVIRRTAAEERRREIFRASAIFGYGKESESLMEEQRNEFGGDEATMESLCRRALSSVSRRQREVLQLVFYHDMTLKEAAAVMGVGIGSARVHYERGKEKLREWLGKSEIAHEMQWGRRERPATVS